MGKKSDLSPECQKFVKKLFAFFSKEKATKKPIVSFDRVYQRTYLKLWGCRTLQCTVLWMVRGLVSQIDPKKELKFWTTLIIVKRTIHGLYSQKIAPTVSTIHKEMKDSLKISKSKLTLTLIDLGYTYKKYVMIEEFCTIKCLLSMIDVIIWERSNLLGKQDMISCTWVKHGLTKITAQIICGFRMMGLMPQKYPRVKANVWLFCMQVREVRVWLTAAIYCFWPNRRMVTITRRWMVLSFLSGLKINWCLLWKILAWLC